MIQLVLGLVIGFVGTFTVAFDVAAVCGLALLTILWAEDIQEWLEGLKMFACIAPCAVVGSSILWALWKWAPIHGDYSGVVFAGGVVGFYLALGTMIYLDKQ